jgi:hypothetical protein
MNLNNINKLIDHLKRMEQVGHTAPFDLSNWLVYPAAGYSSSRMRDYAPPAETAAKLLAQMEGRASPEENFKCDTVACIAGHAALVASAEGVEQSGHIEATAREWLDISEEASHALFTPKFTSRNTEDREDYEGRSTYSDVTIADAIYALVHLRDHGYVRFPDVLSPTRIVDPADPAYKKPDASLEGWYDYINSYGYSDDPAA